MAKKVEEALSAEDVAAKAWDDAEQVDDGDEGQTREGASPDEVETEEPAVVEGEEAEGDETEGDDEGEGRTRNADGTFAKEEGEEGEQPAAEEQPAAAAAAAAGAVPGAADEAQPGVQQQEPVQPNRFLSWRPAEREALLALKGPEAELVRAAAARREAQIEGQLRETEGMRRFTNEFIAQAEPYRPLYARLGVSPMHAFSVLMRSAAIIYDGDPRMKAQEVAALIRDRSIDPNLVADFLDGKTVDGQTVARPDPMVQQMLQRLDQVNQRLDSRDQSEEQRTQAQADQHVATWAKDKAWYHDVKPRMQLLFKAAAEMNEELTLDQAYATAISMDPEISRLEAQRVKATSVKAKQADAVKAKRAASSPRNSPAPKGRHAPGSSPEESVAEAWDEVEGRVA